MWELVKEKGVVVSFGGGTTHSLRVEIVATIWTSNMKSLKGMVCLRRGRGSERIRRLVKEWDARTRAQERKNDIDVPTIPYFPRIPPFWVDA
jgi:hypothetical protein